jgi:hypothetical protein
LLQPSNAAARWLALKLLLDREDDDRDVVEARAKIPTSPWVRAVMRDRHPDGWWGEPHPGGRKFNGTMYRLEALADVGMPGDDPRVVASCEFFIERAELPGEGFSPRQTEPRVPHECGSGRMLYVLNRFGYGQDARVKASARWLLANQMLDGGWNCGHHPKGRLQPDGAIRMDHECSLDKPNHRSSLFTTMAVLKGLSSMKRPPRAAIKRGVDFLLEHRVYRARKSNRAIYGWPPALLFPPVLHYDGLQPLRVLTTAGARYDARLDEALDYLASRADAKGRWPADGTPLPPGKKPEFALKIEDGGKPNKWVTVHALAALRHFGRIELPIT